MEKIFKSTAYGKWILAGEHAVLRGGSCLVLPLKSRYVELTFERAAVSFARKDPLKAAPESSLQLEFTGQHGDEYKMIFWGVLERVCELLKIQRTQLSGKLKLNCILPLGAGLGASASLCVLMTRWLHELGFVQASEEFNLARQLENLFHGESSGVDIASALTGRPLEFKVNELPTYFDLSWRPRLYVSYSGQRGVTKECVERVKSLGREFPEKLKQIDAQMQESVSLCRQALGELSIQTEDQEQKLNLLKKGIDLAQDCFERWGLAEGVVAQHQQKLRAAGAAAVKPTGSGGGGYILSLWTKEPPKDLAHLLLPCF